MLPSRHGEPTRELELDSVGANPAPQGLRHDSPHRHEQLVDPARQAVALRQPDMLLHAPQTKVVPFGRIARAVALRILVSGEVNEQQARRDRELRQEVQRRQPVRVLVVAEFPVLRRIDTKGLLRLGESLSNEAQPGPDAGLAALRQFLDVALGARMVA